LDAAGAQPIRGPAARESGRCEGFRHRRGPSRVDRAIDPADILSMVTAMAMSWSPASLQVAASADDSDDIHDRRRAALATAVRQAFTEPT
jgi:hypothetical protein